MIATLEKVQILDEADGLAKMILSSDVADHYRHCLYILKHDKNAQSFISQFMKAKDQFEDVQRFGRYHPDYKKLSSQVRQLKRELDLLESVANFKKAENQLQHLLDEISVLIGHSVSKQIKVATGNPFFDTGSNCGTGGCGTGGKCGCS
ncbi:YlbF family regulator [Bacillus sp. HMF5848]|uniref:YlbF family regulator n=1 Tax=Bacillus sp. HMF5848 TaxID=2495421 RepID=UPI000F7B8FBB|nr:YlbF family regulator [Bacillus sp. HMF5848]RSK26914.1 YlbF family regulator [Bacillus sp. HMF5848]